MPNDFLIDFDKLTRVRQEKANCGFFWYLYEKTKVAAQLIKICFC